MNDHCVPTFNPLFRFQWEKAQNCYVLLYPEGMIKLNPSAGEILALIDGNRSLDEITTELERKFPDAGTLGDDVREFIGVAHEQNWLRLQ